MVCLPRYFSNAREKYVYLKKTILIEKMMDFFTILLFLTRWSCSKAINPCMLFNLLIGISLFNKKRFHKTNINTPKIKSYMSFLTSRVSHYPLLIIKGN